MADFATVEQAIEDIKAGKMVVVVDDEDRENEGDLIIAGDHVTPEAINFMAKYAKGLICTPIDGARLDALQIPQMVTNNTDNHETAFTVSIDAYDTETGISAFERAKPVRALALRLRLRGYFFLCVTFFLSVSEMPFGNPRTKQEHSDAKSPFAKIMKVTS